MRSKPHERTSSWSHRRANKHPASGVPEFRVTTSEGSRYLVSIDNTDVTEREPAERATSAERIIVDSLIGMCAFNRSDEHFLGRVVRGGPRIAT